MKRNNFYQWLPSIFIGIGIILWTYSLGFSTITNRHEKNLINDWKVSLEKGIKIAYSINNERRLAVAAAIIKRPDDRIFLEYIDEVLALQKKTFRLLDEKLAQGDTSSHQIIMDFKAANNDILERSQQRNPIVSKNDIEDVIAQQSFQKGYFSDDIELFFYTQKQQILSMSIVNINFFSQKVGGHVICSWRRTEPLIHFGSNLLKKGQLTKGKILLSDIPCDENTIFYHPKYIVNGEELPEKDGLVKYKQTFNSTSPQPIEVVFEYEKQFIKNQRIVTDTITTKENFIIYPISN